MASWQITALKNNLKNFNADQLPSQSHKVYIVYNTTLFSNLAVMTMESVSGLCLDTTFRVSLESVKVYFYLLHWEGGLQRDT